MIAKTLACAFVLTAGALLATTPVRSQSAEPVVYYFGAAGCDYCANGLAFLTRWKAADPRMTLRAFDIVASPDDATAFVVVTNAIGLADPRIPMTVVGHHVFVGYEGEETTGEEICSASIWMRRRVNQDETRRPSGMMIDAGHASGKRFD